MAIVLQTQSFLSALLQRYAGAPLSTLREGELLRCVVLDEQLQTGVGNRRMLPTFEWGCCQPDNR